MNNADLLAIQYDGQSAHQQQNFSATELQNWLQSKLSALLEVNQAEIDIYQPFKEYGISSAEAISLSGELAELLDCELTPTIVYDYPTIAQLAHYLTIGERPHEQISRTAAPWMPPAPGEPVDPLKGDAIAIIGMACRFPGNANTPEAFWHLLKQGKDARTEIPVQRWNIDDYYDPSPETPGKMYTRYGCFLEDLDHFDAAFFGFSPRETVRMDPQQRLLLETAWEALENAGLAADALAGSQTGVFIGMMNNFEYTQIQMQQGDETWRDDPYFGTGSASSMVSGRLAYHFDFKGPTLTVDTACSSSLVSLHLACQSLRNNECSLALVGGTNAILWPENMVNACKMGMLSADGYCKTFDAAADGFVLGEGCGIVVVKRLSQARADGNTILAIVRGTAVNQDGRSNGITAPNRLAQEAVIRQALASANLAPERVSYVEAHGSGTALGDPIEIGALQSVLGAGRSTQQPLLVGTVKTNIGHLAGAAGIAGLIKTILALQHKEIPPHLHLNELNPHIAQQQNTITIPTRLTPWPAQGEARIAGVSSFGWSGTNAHVVLEEAPSSTETSPSHPGQLLVLSARTGSALEMMITNLQTYLQQQPNSDLADLAFTLQAGRKAFTHRYMQISTTVAEAIKQLAQRQGTTSTITTGKNRLMFLLPDQGALTLYTALGLYSEEVTFRTEIDRCADLLTPYLNMDPRRILYPSEEQRESALQQLQHITIAQPLLFMITYALAKMWQSWGLSPQSMLGYGIGEYVAACLAGVVTLEDALLLAVTRCRLQQQIVTTDGTALVFVVDHLTTLIQRMSLQAPAIPYLSNLSGDWITEQEATDPAYWVRHLLQTTYTLQDMERYLKEPDTLLLEVGPTGSFPVLNGQHSTKQQRIFASLRHPDEHSTDRTFLLNTWGQLWCAGADINWSTHYIDEHRRALPLPTYPFERKRYWIDLITSKVSSPRKQESPKPSHTTLKKQADIGNWFYHADWQQIPLPPIAKQAQTAVKRWLIFMDESGPGAPLADTLEHRGATVMRVRIGQHFAQERLDSFTLRPGQNDDYHKLCQALLAGGQIPQVTVHCWSVTTGSGTESSPEQFQQHQQSSFYSLLYFVQALTTAGLESAHRLVILSNQVQHVTGQEILQPEKAPLLGICRVISQEYPHIACCNIDLNIAPGASWHDAIELEQLVAECLRPLSDLTIAYRARERWLQRYQPLHLASSSSSTVFRQGGVYLITGGLGNIALLLAEYLAQTVQARLVLVSRSTLPPRGSWDTEKLHCDPAILHKIQRIQNIEMQGGEVLLLQGDVADTARMQAIIQQTDEHFGALHGVIHAAGIVTRTAFKPIQLADRASCEMHFQPKVYGTIALEQALQGRTLDFCLLFSSLSTILGGLGFVAYSASNAFLDAFAQQHNQHSTVPWISVNWDGWPSDASTAQANGTSSALVMTEQESWEAVTRALASGQAHLVHSTGNLHARMEQWLRPESSQDTTQPLSITSPARISPDRIFSRLDYEQEITSVWQQVLGLQDIRSNDNFFDIGGNSLLTFEVIARLKKVFQRPIPTVALFEAPTINALVNYLQPLAEQEAVQTAPKRHTIAPQKEVKEDDIAIIGMAGRFPGATTVDEFWQNLRNGRESISFFSEEELLEAGVDAALLKHPKYVRARPVLKEIDLFDATFFDYSPREAELMDPQHRLFLECAWEALESACYDPSTYTGPIGVYAGANLSTYLLSLMTDKEMLGPVNDYQVVIGNDKDSLTTTVSYKLNLRGPSFAVQTFCSTSLVAVHLACQSLRRGECQMALAGGVSIRVPWKIGYLYEEGGMESPDGHCRTFDAQARGSLFGDGVAAVVLKPLSQALADGDIVHAVIKGSAINNDGALKVSYTAPSVVGQSEVITAALANAGVPAESISYIEAHGTATRLGDPIEIAALTKAFRTQTDRQKFCALGSVKTNVGHLDRAAGVTGLIKTVQALKEKEIPASLHYQSPNPEINFVDSPFYVNTQLSRWTSADGPRRAGVSSLGMGGTNAHVIVEEAPEQPPSGPSRPWQLLLISARTHSTLEAATNNMRAYLQAHKETPLADIAYTLQKGRKRFEYRRVLLSRDHDEAIRLLEQHDTPLTLSRISRRTEIPVTFMLPGIGEQYVGMVEEVYYREAPFRQIIDHCSELLQDSLNIDLRQIIFNEKSATTTERSSLSTNAARSAGVLALLKQSSNQHKTPAQASKLAQTTITQPIVFVIEYALAQLFMHWGVQPQALLGHSLGEYVAACLAGIFSLEDALALVIRQAQLMQDLPQNMMLAVALSEQEVRSYINERVYISIINAPRTCVLSGSSEDIMQLEELLTNEGISHVRVKPDDTFQPTLSEPQQQMLLQIMQNIQLNTPRIPMLSNVTGTWITDEQATDPAYWVHRIGQTVRFMDNITHLLQETEGVLLEVGPGQALSSLVKQHPLCESERTSLVLTTAPLLMERHSEYRSLLLTLGKLWLHGVNIDWQGFYAQERRRSVSLPSYPFERRRYWIEPRSPQALLAASRSLAHPAPALPEISSSATTVTHILPKEALTNWFYVPGWRSAMRLPAAKTRQVQDGGSHIVFLNTTSLNSKVVQRLRELEGDVIAVRNASTFTKVDEANYTVNPVERHDYASLIEQLRMHGKPIQRLVLLWSIGEEGQSINDAQSFGLYSLIALAQALGDAEIEECQIKVVTSETQVVNGDERIIPTRMSLVGPCQVLSQEYAHLWCSTIDIQLPQASSQQETDVVRQLVDEIVAKNREALVALRTNRRWLPCFEALHLEREESQALPLRTGGVYMITGGLGGIAMALANFLAHEYQAKLVLLGRNGLPSPEHWTQILIEKGASTEVRRRIQQIQSLKTMGAEVLVVQADVRDEEQMRSAIQQAQERFGTIHGVFHAAGVPGVGLTQFKTIEQVQAVLGPKVEGTIVLEKVLADVHIDLLVLFSSIAAQIGGGPGQIDYSAANAFLSTYALSQKKTGRYVVAIEWGEWQWNAWEAGLSGYNAAIQTFLRESRQRSGITFEEGIEALKRVLATDLTHVIVSPQNFQAKIAETEQLTATHNSIQEAQKESLQEREKHPRPELATSYVPPRNDTEQSIASLWESLLGITAVGINDNFFELGGNSLTGIDLITRLRKTFHLKSLASYMLYEAPTVSKMAQYIENGQSAQEVKERIDRGEKRRESRNRNIHEAKKARRQNYTSNS